MLYWKKLVQKINSNSYNATFSHINAAHGWFMLTGFVRWSVFGKHLAIVETWGCNCNRKKTFPIWYYQPCFCPPLSWRIQTKRLTQIPHMFFYVMCFHAWYESLAVSEQIKGTESLLHFLSSTSPIEANHFISTIWLRIGLGIWTNP